MRMRKWLTGFTFLTLLTTGCAHRGESVTVKYVPSSSLPSEVTLRRGGDFALFYDDSNKPEIPIRLRAGETIGFDEGKDGRVQAVAGEFRINLPGDADQACWRRLSTRPD